jgi:hypothetical protein
MGALLAATVGKRERLIEHFRSQGALSARHTIAKPDLDATEEAAWRQLVASQIICEPTADRYHLDTRGLDRLAVRRKRRVTVMVWLPFCAILIAWMLAQVLERS